jgi:hypothetical protein
MPQQRSLRHQFSLLGILTPCLTLLPIHISWVPGSIYGTMYQSPGPSQGNRNRNGARRSNGPTTISSLPPYTPRRPKSGIDIDNLILSLEDEWRLGLKVRGPLWSPQKADKKSTAEKVYGLVQRLFYSAGPALDSALDMFREAAPGFPHDKRLELLHGLLKCKTCSPVSRADTPLNEPPKSLMSIHQLC